MEEVTINPTIEPRELTQDWGNRLLEGTNKTPHPGKRSSDTIRDNSDLPVSVQESLLKAWVGDGLLKGWGH